MSAGTQRTQRYVYRLDSDRVIQSFMYVLQFCIYIPMYLPQAVLHQPSIGAASGMRLDCTNPADFEVFVLALYL